MRAIARMDDEANAAVFSDYLYAKGIQGHIERDPAGGWAVYVHSEDDLATAKQELEQFLRDPQAPEYTKARQAAEARRQEEARGNVEYARKQVNVRAQWRPTGLGPLTALLVAASVIATYFTLVAPNEKFINQLFISLYERSEGVWLPEVGRGEVWRLWTPMFVHFSFMHILFNMFWLYDLGTMIERRQGTWVLAILVAVIAPLSNVAQYLWSGPEFGGMSGVVYGLFGYVWIRGRFDPASALRLPPSAVGVMLVWLVLCTTGLLGPIANAAHVVGLAAGMAWGFISAKLTRGPVAAG